MSTQANTSISSIYLHFPFCESKCHYCDFYSLAKDRTKTSDVLLFEDSIAKEISMRAENYSFHLDTLFLGGGTPSMTDPEVVARVMEPILSRGGLNTDYEWTMEANPSSVSYDRLKKYRTIGVNRLSMGVQSLDDKLLKALGRVHSTGDVFRALDAALEAGFENISVDLLCGVPGQPLQHLEEAMNRLTSYPITHLSCYLLTLPKSHWMYSQLPGEDIQLEHLLFIDQKMTEMGFEHYEISNFARRGLRARHNMVYWQGKEYLSFGPSAHSFVDGKRWKNFSSIHSYAKKLSEGIFPIEIEEALTEAQLEIEKWMLALRLSDGFPIDWLKNDNIRSKCKKFEETGFIRKHPVDAGRLQLTPKGLAVSDQIIAGITGCLG